MQKKNSKKNLLPIFRMPWDIAFVKLLIQNLNVRCIRDKNLRAKQQWCSQYHAPFDEPVIFRPHKAEQILPDFFVWDVWGFPLILFCHGGRFCGQNPRFKHSIFPKILNKWNIKPVKWNKMCWEFVTYT